MTNANRPGGTKSNPETDEHRPARTSNDRVQELERRGVTPERNRGHDETARNSSVTGAGKASVRGKDEDAEDVDPDSASSDVDRDDTVDR